MTSERHASKLSKVAEGLAAWLAYEARCGRSGLLCEAYLRYALTQLVKCRYPHPRRVRPERPHPVLNRDRRPGRKRSVDYVVFDGHGRREVGVEVKWASGRSSQAYEILKDALRQTLFVANSGRQAFIILAGMRPDMRELLKHEIFSRNPHGVDHRIAMPTKEGVQVQLLLEPKPGHGPCQAAYARMLTESFKKVPLPIRTGLECTKHFSVRLEDEDRIPEILVWRVLPHVVSKRTFVPGEGGDDTMTSTRQGAA